MPISYEEMKELAIAKENLLKEEEYKNRQLQQENEKLKKQLEMMFEFQEKANEYEMMSIQKDKDIKEERFKAIKYKQERDSLKKQFDYLRAFDLILPIDSGDGNN